MPRPSLTRPIPDDHQGRRDWRVAVNGAEVDPVASVTLDHPRLGTLSYGWTAGGHDGWTFHEEGGGGSVVVPWAILDGVLHVAVVLQHRPNQGGDAWNAPRGFLEPSEDRRLGAARELAEEVGLRAPASTVVELPGARANPNSAFFETWGEGEGVTFFAVEVAAALLAYRGGAWEFLPEALDDSPELLRSRAAEAIRRAQFVPWWEAARLADLHTSAAVARLLAHLRDRSA